MCGILCVLGDCCCNSVSLKDVEKVSKILKHRGPDATGIVSLSNEYILCHERLSIVATKNGDQPFEWIDQNRQIHLSVNGEIYNFKDLYRDYLSEICYRPKTFSDSEVILHLYRKYGINFLSLLRGMYSFILLDTNKNKNETKIFFARDVIGIKPFWIGYDYENKKCIYLSSELKAISKIVQFVESIKPGHYFYGPYDKIINNNKHIITTSFYFPLYHNNIYNYYNNDNFETIKLKIKSLLTESVKLRMLRDTNNGIKIGAYLSGGLDSSLIAAIAAQFTDTLYTFSVGLKYYDYSTNKEIIGDDIIAARKVVKHLSKICKIHHFECLYHPNDVIKNDGQIIKDTIFAFESYDEPMLRACISNLMVAQLAHKNNIKLILTGDGADEIFGGYLHLKYYKNGNNLQKRLVSMISKLTTHLKRQDGCSMNYGIEARVPFLDEMFVSYVMTINPKYKLHSFENKFIEKYLLRLIFNDDNIIPNEILWRQKVTFSTGVGIKLYSTLSEFCNKKITNLQMRNVKKIYPINTPKSKTQFYYRQIFENYFGQNRNNCVEFVVDPTDKFRTKWYDELNKISSKL
eukprot:314047_1